MYCYVFIGLTRCRRNATIVSIYRIIIDAKIFFKKNIYILIIHVIYLTLFLRLFFHASGH